TLDNKRVNVIIIFIKALRKHSQKAVECVEENSIIGHCFQREIHGIFRAGSILSILMVHQL
ncbi:MAG: hypothetical protein Q4B70_04725, partial [Lachnospiraceae bacterium]|nr:hypothetical protein [Lachnospiraceae bacterium]